MHFLTPGRYHSTQPPCPRRPTLETLSTSPPRPSPRSSSNAASATSGSAEPNPSVRPASHRRPAFTFRFVPAREDLATPESWASPISTRAAIEAMPPAPSPSSTPWASRRRHLRRHPLRAPQIPPSAALITDGVVRDLAGVLRTGLPVWCAGVAAPPPSPASPSSPGSSPSPVAESPSSRRHPRRRRRRRRCHSCRAPRRNRRRIRRAGAVRSLDRHEVQAGAPLPASTRPTPKPKPATSLPQVLPKL